MCDCPGQPPLGAQGYYLIWLRVPQIIRSMTLPTDRKVSPPWGRRAII